jgi:hypothetical protein
MDAKMQDFLANSLGLFMNPHIQSCLAIVKGIAGYELTAKHKEPFLAFHRYITDPQPDFISTLRADPKKEHWYHLLVNGILGNVQSSFSCVLYHQERLVHVEAALMQSLKRHNVSEKMGNSTLALGGTSVLDFEYQAYVLAYRRCLDQFAGAIAAFFKNRYSSFRTLPTFLGHRKPQEVAKAICDIHFKYTGTFEFVLSEGGVTSVRDRIAHYEFVPAGCVNISVRGIVLVGGGENLNLGNSNESTLTQVLAQKTDSLHWCIEEMLQAFINSVTAWERSNRGMAS